MSVRRAYRHRPSDLIKPERTQLRANSFAWTSFPTRVWEYGPNGWSSRPLEKRDIERRKSCTVMLGAVSFNLGNTNTRELSGKMSRLVETLSEEQKAQLKMWLKPEPKPDPVLDEPALTDEDLGIDNPEE